MISDTFQVSFFFFPSTARDPCKRGKDLCPSIFEECEMIELSSRVSYRCVGGFYCYLCKDRQVRLNKSVSGQKPCSFFRYR